VGKIQELMDVMHYDRQTFNPIDKKNVCCTKSVLVIIAVFELFIEAILWFRQAIPCPLKRGATPTFIKNFSS
jgi:hypothetical protein